MSKIKCEIYAPVTLYLYSVLSSSASYSCPGMIRCRGSKNCVTTRQRCDGIRHCRYGDDELYCDLTCPSRCRCHSLTYTCTDAGFDSVPLQVSTAARALNLTGNALVISDTVFDSFYYLVELSISSNGIQNISCCPFKSQHNLQYLDLSSNDIRTLPRDVFRGLRNLRELVLHGNPLVYIDKSAFGDLVSLPKLDLSGMQLKFIMSQTFSSLKSLSHLDISNNLISTLEDGAFQGLSNLANLNISRNVIETFLKRDFEDLYGLEYLESDDYMFCCFVSLPASACLPGVDEVSSCENLMSHNALRAFLWILTVFSIFGNTFVLVWRSMQVADLLVPNYLIKNLAVADFLMGVYMLVLAIVDAHYRGRYIENATRWRLSWTCQVLGFFSAVSSEASVLTLFVVTCDRMQKLLFPFSNFHLTLRSARAVMTIVWVTVIVLFLIPMMPSEYFRGQFYSRSGVCVALYITPDPSPGWEYSFVIFHGLNFAVFLLMWGAYVLMYKSIKNVGSQAQKGREMKRARKMTFLVFVDFCCWVPINTLGTKFADYSHCNRPYCSHF